MATGADRPKRPRGMLTNRAASLSRWLRQPWKINDKGNLVLHLTRHILVIEKTYDVWHCSVFHDGLWMRGLKGFLTLDAAKLALFDYLRKPGLPNCRRSTLRHR